MASINASLIYNARMAYIPQYITAEEVVSLLQRQDPHVAIIDVRDDDFCDGHIKGARQYSSGKFGWEGHIDKLIESFSTDISLVIVHCQLSQVRAPKCARRLSERLGSEKWSQKEGKPEIKVLRYGYDGFFDQVHSRHPELFQQGRE